MKIKKLSMLLALGIVLGGCARDGQDGEGRLRIAFSADPTVEDVVVTRALGPLDLESLLPDASDFNLVIKDAGGETVGTPWASISDFPNDGVILSLGSYTATAFCAVNEQVLEGFDCPRFGCTKPFDILSGATTPLNLKAFLLNMAVTVECTDEFEGYFSNGYNVTIERGNEMSIDFAQQGSHLAAFIEPEPFTVVVSGTLPNGKPYSHRFDVEDDAVNNIEIAPRKYQKIVIDVNEGQVGYASISINFNDVETEVIPIIEVGE